MAGRYADVQPHERLLPACSTRSKLPQGAQMATMTLGVVSPGMSKTSAICSPLDKMEGACQGHNMVFGLFKKPARAIDTAALGALFDELREQWPGAGCMFARGIGTATMILTTASDLTWRVRRHVFYEFIDSATKHFAADDVARWSFQSWRRAVSLWTVSVSRG